MPKIEPIAGFPAPHRMKFVADVPGEFRDMVVHEGVLIVLTDRGLFRMVGGKLEPIPFEPETPLYYSSDDGTFKP